MNEGDASATRYASEPRLEFYDIDEPIRCDFYKCKGDNHNMQPALFKQMLDRALEQGGQFNVKAQAKHFHNRYEDSKKTNPNFYFVPPSALIVIGATYFHPGLSVTLLCGITSRLLNFDAASQTARLALVVLRTLHPYLLLRVLTSRVTVPLFMYLSAVRLSLSCVAYYN